jgi:hypothetical protein
VPGKLAYSAPLYKNPGNGRAFGICCQWLFYNITRKLSSLVFTSQWQLLYAKTPVLPTSLHRFKKVLPSADRIWADPFVIKAAGYTIFFEEKLFKDKNAHISCIQCNENGVLINSKPLKVLKEKHHLSYPFVFVHNSEHYMMPESAAAKELNLYKSFDFPGEWKKIRTLITGKRIYDATLHLHNGTWFLFCNEKEDDRLSSDAYLHIYYSDNLLDAAFQPHPMNPVYRDVTRARPAGSLFIHDNKLIRPSQVSAPSYGSAIQFNHVTELTIHSFKEDAIEILQPTWQKNIMGMHTINHAGNFSVADIQVKRSRWF